MTALPGSEREALMAELARVARAHAGADGEPVVLSERSGGLVVAVGAVIAKAHPAGTEPAQLQARVNAAASAPLRDLVLAPLQPRAFRARDRLVTLWPQGEPVAADDPDAAPWDEAALLLARLHAVPLSAAAALARLPAAGGPARVERALWRLRSLPESGDKRAVLAAAATLPALPRGGEALVHGDWHLGQLVRAPGAPRDASSWRLIDVDDLGRGDPAWDLARPAALYATGIILAHEWQRFVEAYRIANGPAVPAAGDPWPALDLPARALVVQTAATALIAAEREARELDDIGEQLVSGCRRIARVAATR